MIAPFIHIISLALIIFPIILSYNMFRTYTNKKLRYLKYNRSFAIDLGISLDHFVLIKKAIAFLLLLGSIIFLIIYLNRFYGFIPSHEQAYIEKTLNQDNF